PQEEERRAAPVPCPAVSRPTNVLPCWHPGNVCAQGLRAALLRYPIRRRGCKVRLTYEATEFTGVRWRAAHGGEEKCPRSNGQARERPRCRYALEEPGSARIRHRILRSYPRAQSRPARGATGAGRTALAPRSAPP